MRWRLLRRCLLFGLLGLVTSVAVAWGLSVRWQGWFQTRAPSAEGVAVWYDRIITMTMHELPGQTVESWELTDWTIPGQRGDIKRAIAERILEIGGAGYEDEYWDAMAALAEELASGSLPQRWESRRIDHLAARGPPLAVQEVADMDTVISRCMYGWPAPALRYTQRHEMYGVDRNELGIPASIDSEVAMRSAIEIPWPWKTADPPTMTPETIALPLAPRPGLLLNTIFYALLWVAILLAPGALRRRIRRARGRCPKCGYLLRGQPAPGCPECGHGREAAGERPQPAANRQRGPAPA